MAEGIVNGTVCYVLPGYELGMHGVFPVGLRVSGKADIERFERLTQRTRRPEPRQSRVGDSARE